MLLKFIRKHLDIDLLRISLVFAFIYTLLFNSAVIIHRFEYYNISVWRAVLELGKDSIYIYLSLFILFLGLTIHRLVFVIGALFLFVTGAIASYYLYLFKISPTKEVMEAFFCSDVNEIYELVSAKLVIWLIFSLFVCVYTIRHFNIQNAKLLVTKLLSAICLLLTINSVIAPHYKVLNNYFPIQYLHNSFLFFSNGLNPSSRIDIHQQFAFADNSPEDLIAVLVIGESARFDHFGINGYERNTTPRLKDISNLFSFQAQSCSNVTHISVPCLLSRHSSSNFINVMKERSFLSILTHLGFNTSWIGTQSLTKYLKTLSNTTIYDDVDFVMIPGGSTLLKMNDHDGLMLPYIDNIVNKNPKPGKQFLVIHTSGSHWNYTSRYPKKFNHFTPDCNYVGNVDFRKADPSSCSPEGLINTYDNSILYTDFFLSHLIDLLKDKTAFLIYVSDHGESLGERGRYCHGGISTPEQTTIPFIVWASDKLHVARPGAVRAIQSHAGKEINHDYVFHTVFDCLGISSEIIDKKLSLCELAD